MKIALSCMLPNDGEGQKKKNPHLSDGLEMVFEGKKYRLEYKEFNWTNNKNSIYYGQKWPYYKVVDVHKKMIGKITTFTKDVRIYSLLYRYNHPAHMTGLTIMGRVSKNAKDRLYVAIPKREIEDHDLKVDDAVDITITRIDGASLTETYHIANNTGNLNISLSRFKRYAKLDGKFEKLSYKTYKEDMKNYGNGKESEYDWFVKAGDYVKVVIDPNPDRQCYDFTKESMKEIKKLVKASLKTPEERAQEDLDLVSEIGEIPTDN